jgi:ABC-2 type transport system permease protein
MFEKYGIRVGTDIVCYPYDNPPDRFDKIVCKDYTWHDVVKDFKKEEYAVYLPLTRSISYSTAEDKTIETSGLIHTVKEGWAEEDVATLAEEAGAEYNAGKDTGGPITVASAAWKEGEGGMRLVVMGDSDFATRTFAMFAPTNQNLFENSINWLGERIGLIAIAPKTIQKVRINATATQKRAVFFVGIVALPVLVLVIGGIVFFIRRR